MLSGRDMLKPKIQGGVYVYQLLDICADRDVCPLLFGKQTKCPQFWLNCTREQYSHCMQCHLKIDTERLDSHFMDCRKQYCTIYWPTVGASLLWSDYTMGIILPKLKFVFRKQSRGVIERRPNHIAVDVPPSCVVHSHGSSCW